MVPVIDAIARAKRLPIRKPLCGQRALELITLESGWALPGAAEKLFFNIGRLGVRQSWPPAQSPFLQSHPFLSRANGKSCRRAEKEAMPWPRSFRVEKINH
jgi:hypothetical protein